MSSEVEPGGAVAGGFAPRILMRDYFSTRLLWLSFYAAGQACVIEDRHTGEPTFDLEHNANVLSAIVSAAGFLEAAVNELFQDAADGHGRTGDGYIATLSDAGVETIAALWIGTNDGRNLNPLEKWQVLLTANGQPPLDRGAAPFQNANLVTQLRNAIVHFRPEDIDQDDAHSWETRLKGKFAPNRLMDGSGNAWWPSHCLGYGCAIWAAKAALAFADDVSARLGIRPNYRRVADDGWMGTPPPEWPSGT